jgi:hypothetical protein
MCSNDKFWREGFGGKVLAGRFWREGFGGKVLAGRGHKDDMRRRKVWASTFLTGLSFSALEVGGGEM